MSESTPEPKRAEFSNMNEFLERKMEAFEGVCAHLIENPPRGDPYLATAARAVRWGMRLTGPLQDAIFGVWIQQPDVNASELFTRIVRAEQKAVYGQPGWEGYPEKFAPYPGPWYEAMKWIGDDAGRYSSFLQHVYERPKSNVLGRRKGILAVGAIAMRLRRITQLDYTDVGTSLILGPNEIASGLPQAAPNVVRSGSRNHRISLPHTRALGMLLNDSQFRIPAGEVLANDLDDINDPRRRRSAILDSFYPHELLDRERVELFHAHIGHRYPNIHFIQGDYCKLDLKSIYDNWPPGADTPADTRTPAEKKKTAQSAPRKITCFETVLHQSPPEARAAMLAQAEAHTTELIVVQDFTTETMDFPEDWRRDPFPYRTLVKDMREDPRTRRYREWFRWRDGRCMEMEIGAGRLLDTHGRSVSAWSVIDGIAKDYR